MAKPFILVNTSRGLVVQAEAVLYGLESGKIIGACLDVWETEPLSKMAGAVLDVYEHIIKMPQVVVTPHIAGYTHEALYKMSKILLYKIING
jgi:D-3-phosphoglycerate dehydrogenase / 2-oxoglutarate reductase